MFRFFKKLKRRRALAQPFPEAWQSILESHTPMYAKLTKAEQKELRDHVTIFLSEKHVEGCGGLEITDEIRVTIATQACLLLLHRPNDCFPKLKSVLAYPTTYFSDVEKMDPSGVVRKEQVARLGESWGHGTVVLAWDSVRSGASDIRDGRNVVLHEFAHRLDQQDGVADGAPILGRGLPYRDRRSRYLAWARVMSGEFDKHRRQAAKGRKTVMDHYGATEPAEFFAVATECFFEKPRQLSRKHPELYSELSQFYRQDPVNWQS